MAALANLTFYYEVHDGDRIYRMYEPVPQEPPGNANMTLAGGDARARLQELCRVPQWNLFMERGQVCTLQDPAWRIDVQARDAERYLWAFQGPPGPPTYAVVRADSHIERFGEMLVKGRVKLAMWNSMTGRHTWYIRVEVLRKDKRRRPQHGDTYIQLPGLPAMLKQCNANTVLAETKVDSDVANLYMCTEQSPKKATMSPDLSEVLVHMLRMWVKVIELWTSVEVLAELASSMASRDTVHGSIETTAGGLGVTSGGLMLGGFWFPPLFIAGAVVGGISAAGGLTNSAIDHAGTTAAQTTLKEHHGKIREQLKGIEEAAAAIKADSKVRSLSVEIDCGKVEVVAEYILAASALAADLTSTVASCFMAAPKLAEGGKTVLDAANLAKLPDAINFQRSLSTASTAASTADLVAAPTAAGSSASSAAASAGSAASKAAVIGGVVSIAAGGVQLGFGIARLVSGGSTTAEINKLCENARSIAKNSQDLATGCTALVSCAHKVDTAALMCLVSGHVGQAVGSG